MCFHSGWINFTFLATKLAQDWRSLSLPSFQPSLEVLGKGFFQKDVGLNSISLRLKLLSGYMLWPRCYCLKGENHIFFSNHYSKEINPPFQVKNHGSSGSWTDEESLAIFWQVPGAWKIDGIIDTSSCLVFILAKMMYFPIQHVGKPVWGACLILWMLGGVNRDHITVSFHSGGQKLHTPSLLFSDILPLKNWGIFKIGTPKHNFSKDAAVFTV